MLFFSIIEARDPCDGFSYSHSLHFRQCVTKSVEAEDSIMRTTDLIASDFIGRRGGMVSIILLNCLFSREDFDVVRVPIFDAEFLFEIRPESTMTYPDV